MITRYMNIVQFWTLRNDILKRVGKKYGQDQEHEFQFVDSAGNVVASEEVSTPIEEGVQVYFISPCPRQNKSVVKGKLPEQVRCSVLNPL